MFDENVSNNHTRVLEMSNGKIGKAKGRERPKREAVGELKSLPGEYKGKECSSACYPPIASRQLSGRSLLVYFNVYHQIT